MSNAKVVMGQAANTLVKPLDVEDVFSTYLYEGTGATQTITNGIDLDGEGGLVWIKNRDYNYAHMLFDTEATGVQNVLRLPNTNGLSYDSDTLTSFNSDGFTLGGDSEVNENGTGWSGHASWTFRKAPKFFDVVTYTGDGTDGREIAHNLDCDVGFIVIKNTSSADSWRTLHKDTNMMLLDTTEQAFTAAVTDGSFGDGSTVIRPTSTHFTVAYSNNKPGEIHVAYLFAHNDGDGEFGPSGDQDIIKCGSWDATGNNEIDLGFEPQWLLIKNADGSNNWGVFDTMRGWTADGSIENLKPNLSDAETSENGVVKPTATGFTWIPNVSGNTYIYIAIRRGPLAQPESATEVFDVFTTANGDPAGVYGTVGPVDLNVNKKRDVAYSWRVFDRLRNDYQLNFDSTNADNARDWVDFDEMSGININSTGTTYLTSDSQVHYNWKRAPGFFDVVAYTGDGASLSHNLSVVPNMIIVKNRGTGSWRITSSEVNGVLYLDSNDAANGSSSFQTLTPCTSSTMNLSGISQGGNNIAYLFATLPGVSKVGSFTGTGSAFNVDCGFTAGARFVLIKKTSGTGDWGIFDTVRGITDSSSPLLRLNNTTAEANFDYLDPYSGGFAHSGANLTFNAVGAEYIFYAIA